MTITNIKTPFRRELTVENNGPYDTYLQVTGDDWSTKHDVKTFIPKAQVGELIEALLGENATVVTDLPEAKVDPSFNHSKTVIRSGSSIEYVTKDPAKLVATAKELLAIATFNTKYQEEQAAETEAKAKAKEAAVAEKETARAKRRNELADELAPRTPGLGKNWYSNVSGNLQKAIDRIIELEEAATVS